MKSYIIHLPRAVTRQETVNDLLKLLPNAQILEATDAQNLTEEHMHERYKRQIHRPRYPFSLRNTEIACFLSHRKAWQQIAEGDSDMALVVEDDVVLNMNIFRTALTAALEKATTEDFVRFPCVKQTGIQMEAHTARVSNPNGIGLGTQAQLIGRSAACRLLQATDHFDRPVDTTLQLTWCTGQPILEVIPSGVSEISRKIGGSTIGAKKSLSERLYREVARPWYRAALRITRQFHS